MIVLKICVSPTTENIISFKKFGSCPQLGDMHYTVVITGTGIQLRALLTIASTKNDRIVAILHSLSKYYRIYNILKK